MHRLRLTPLFSALLASFLTCALPSTRAADPAFDGVWTGKIRAPNTDADLGLAFIRTERGLLVSLNFPEMFLHSANFGTADIVENTFSLSPLDLSLTLDHETLTGTFGRAEFPVELHRGGAFTPEPTPPSYTAAPAPRWQRPLGAPIWASPVARDGIVYVGTTDGKFHATRAADGTELWTWSGPHPIHGEALATEENIFVVDDATHLICLDRADGSLVWQVALHDAALANHPPPENETFNHRSATPIIDARGILYVGSTDGGIYAIRARNGRGVWRHNAKSPIYAPLTLRGNELLAACFDGHLLSLNPRNGRETSRIRLGGPLVSAPVVAGERIVIGARDCLLYAIDARTRTTAWRHAYWFSWVESTPRLVDNVLYLGGSDFRRVSAIDAPTGRRRWATDVLGLSWGTPIVTATTVYAATAGQSLSGTVIKHEGGIVALDRTTGKPLWRHATPPHEAADFSGFAGSLTLVDNLLIGARLDGTLIALPISP